MQPRSSVTCVKSHYFRADGINASAAAREFLEHANQEQQHGDWLADRIAIDSYREVARYLGDKDPTSRRIMAEILAQEEEHAEDMVGLQKDLPSG